MDASNKQFKQMLTTLRAILLHMHVKNCQYVDLLLGTCTLCKRIDVLCLMFFIRWCICGRQSEMWCCCTTYRRVLPEQIDIWRTLSCYCPAGCLVFNCILTCLLIVNVFQFCQFCRSVIEVVLLYCQPLLTWSCMWFC